MIERSYHSDPSKWPYKVAISSDRLLAAELWCEKRWDSAIYPEDVLSGWSYFYTFTNGSNSNGWTFSFLEHSDAVEFALIWTGESGS
jgi:hypothetical protein